MIFLFVPHDSSTRERVFAQCDNRAHVSRVLKNFVLEQRVQSVNALCKERSISLTLRERARYDVAGWVPSRRNPRCTLSLVINGARFDVRIVEDAAARFASGGRSRHSRLQETLSISRRFFMATSFATFA